MHIAKYASALNVDRVIKTLLGIKGITILVTENVVNKKLLRQIQTYLSAIKEVNFSNSVETQLFNGSKIRLVKLHPEDMCGLRGDMIIASRYLLQNELELIEPLIAHRMDGIIMPHGIFYFQVPNED